VEFFTANIRNPHTRRAYARACGRFFAWCETRDLTLTTIRPFDVATYMETLQHIRRCRQELFHHTDRAPIKNVAMAWNFFSTNECRDLLFHVCEHRLTLSEIAAFLAENKLQFLRFVLDPQTLRNYTRQFPVDTAMTDLAQWHRFERENPHTFASMYSFLIQKNLDWPDRRS
jgi:hypothetical protein